MTVVLDMPNVEAMTTSWLRIMIPSLSNRVYTGIPKDAVFPLITVKRIGGVSPMREKLDAARIQLDIWGSVRGESGSVNKEAVFNIAAKARTAMYAMENHTFTSPVTGFVTSVGEDMGLIWMPDMPTGRDRYVIAFMVMSHT